MIDKFNFKSQELKDYVTLLLNNGFRVFVYDKDNEKITYIIIEKNNQIGYIQLNDFGGFQFSTTHKPNRTTGTGYALNYNESLNPTLENAEKTFINYPNWAKKNDISSIEKYKSIDDFLSKQVLEDLGYSISNELIDINCKSISICDPANIFMITSKTEEAKDILWRFADNTNLKSDYDYEKFWNSDGGDKEPEFTFSHEYLIKAFKILDLTSTASKIKTKDLSFPIMLENNHFKIVLAPKLKFDYDEDETKLYGVKQ